MDYNELKNLMRNYLGDLVDLQEFESLFYDSAYYTHLQKCIWLTNKYDAMIDYIEEYLKIYGDVNQINGGGDTALHTLCYTKSNNIKRIIEILINAGINVNIQDQQGNTALHYLCTHGYVEKEILEILINAGIDINMQDTYGCTALYYYCSYHKERSSKTIIEIMINLGANIYLLDTQGKAPIDHLSSDLQDYYRGRNTKCAVKSKIN